MAISSETPVPEESGEHYRITFDGDAQDAIILETDSRGESSLAPNQRVASTLPSALRRNATAAFSGRPASVDGLPGGGKFLGIGVRDWNPVVKGLRWEKIETPVPEESGEH